MKTLKKLMLLKNSLRDEDAQVLDIKDLSIIKANSFDVKLEEVIKFENGFKTSFVTFDYKERRRKKYQNE